MGRGGIAGWCIRHPVSTLMLMLTAIVLGLFALTRLPVDLLPQLIYPEIGVRIIDPAVPANIMEDQVTRQIEEQLAITEDAVGIESTTSKAPARSSCTSTTARTSTSRCATPAPGWIAPSASCRPASTRRSSSSATRRRSR
jgi:multidrug efflux pump subunit AcrB